MGKQTKPEDLSLEMPQMRHTSCWKATHFFQKDNAEHMYCGRCYFNSEINDDLCIRRFHAFAYGVFEPRTCRNCGHPILQVRPIDQCTSCVSSYIQLYREIRSMGLNVENIRGIIFDIIDKNVLCLIATDPNYQQLFPQTFELFPYF